MLHGAVRIVQELGKSRASAVAIRGYTVDEMAQQDESMINPTADAMKGEDEAGDAEAGSVIERKWIARNSNIFASFWRT